MCISEIAPPNIRGAYLVLEGATIVIGIVIMFYIVSIFNNSITWNECGKNLSKSVTNMHVPTANYQTYGTRHVPSEWSYRIPFIVQMAPCILLAATLWRLPFSLPWLTQVGRDREALDSLSALRCLPTTDPRVQAEWIMIRAEAIRNRETMATSTRPLCQTKRRHLPRHSSSKWRLGSTCSGLPSCPAR